MCDVKVKLSYDALDSITRATLLADIKTWRSKKGIWRHAEDIELNKERIKAARFLLKTWYEKK